MRPFHCYPETNGRLCAYCCEDARVVVVFMRFTPNHNSKPGWEEDHRMCLCWQHAQVVIMGELV